MTPYYNKGGITIYCGDCLAVMPQLSPPFDAIISDWPYGTTACEWDSIIPLEPLWAECKRLIKGNGAIVLTASQPFTSRLVMNDLAWFKYDLVWRKVRVTGHLDANRKPLREHESVLIFCSGMTTYNPQMKPSGGHTRGPFGYHNNGKSAVYKDFLDNKSRANNATEYYPRSIIKFISPMQPIHPTQKPLSLMAYLIRTYTNPNDLILDNAMGSGTTLVAAQNEGRRAVGIDISEEYCQIAVERLRQPSFWSIPDKPKVEAVQAALI